MKPFLQKMAGMVLLAFSAFARGQVNLQTGAAQVTIPLYSITDGPNGLSTGVSLNYVAGGGLKVDDIASSVGTGWQLAFGGSITRIQRGEPDDQKQRNIYYPLTNNTPSTQELNQHQQYVENYYPNGYLYSEFAPTSQITNAGAYNYLASGVGKDLPHPKFLADREIDDFTFNFNGRSGTFNIAKLAPYKQILIHNAKDSKLQIEVVHYLDSEIPSDRRNTIKSFSIIDETGIKYVFEDQELTQVIRQENNTIYGAGGTVLSSGNYTVTLIPGENILSAGNCSSTAFPVMRGVPLPQYVCNNWVLTKIINPLNGSQIQFAYEDYSISYEGAHTATKTEADGGCSFSVNISSQAEQLKRIKSVSNRFNDKIEFNYGLDRQDIIGDKMLSDISLYENGQFVSKIEFQFGYMCKYAIRNLTDNFTANDRSFLRLCLKQIQKVGIFIDKEPPYKFEYKIDNAHLIPARFSLFKDHWGFFNDGGFLYGGAGVQTNLIPDVGKPYNKSLYMDSFNPDFHKINNTYGLVHASNGLIKEITYPYGGKLSFEYQQNKSFQVSDIPIGGASVSKIILTDGLTGSISNETTYKFIQENLNSSGWGYENPVYTQSHPTIVYKCSGNKKFPVSKIIEKSIKTFFNDGQLNTLINDLSLGVMTTIASQVIVPILVDLFSDDFKSYTITNTFSSPINFSNPLPIQYSRVEVKNINTGIVDIYQFTSPLDYPLEVPNFTEPYSSRKRYAPWKYGLVKIAINKSANGEIVKKVENTYDPVPYQFTITDNLFTSQKWKAASILTGCFPIYYDQGLSDRILLETAYKPFVGKIDLLETKETLYKTPSVFTTTNKTFEYNDYYLPKLITTYNSKSEKVETVFKYANDYTVGGPLATLKTNNNISAPVLTETYVTKAGVKKLLTGSITEYGVLANGNIQPVKSYNTRTDRPVNDNTMAAFSPSQLVRDATYYKPTTEFVYNTDGVMVQTNKLLELNNAVNITNKTALIVDKANPEQVLATATNCNATDIAYTSFETAYDKRSWTYNESLVTYGESVSGNKYFKFDNVVRSISKSGLNAGIKYKITFWAPNTRFIIGGVEQEYIPLVNINNQKDASGNLINNITPTKIYTNEVTGWCLYECLITGANSIYIHNRNTSNNSGVPISIDEIRLYPEGSSMTSATYNIQGLKTTMVDANNKIQYMEYDGLGRLKLIRDEEKNVLKTYEYNFKQ